MLDGSQYIIENFVSHDRDSFNKGIELMKKCNVRFVDPYHLLKALCSNKDINQHIALVEKEKNHDLNFSYFKTLQTNRTTYSSIL